jgi:murein DD-endopeptidase MepM/ murein hydrolase activator NlpD
MRALVLFLAMLTISVPASLLAAAPVASLAAGPAAAPAAVPTSGSISAAQVSGSISATQVSASAGSYRAPVPGSLRVLRGFTPPAVRYQAGHLGVDLAAPTGAEVLAAGAGQVRFAGQVAGRSIVVIAHPDGISTEYEPVAATVRVGELVRSGQPVGRLVGRHRGCPAVGCLHWGARRAGNYLDPLSLLRPLGVVRLLPWDGG